MTISSPVTTVLSARVKCYLRTRGVPDDCVQNACSPEVPVSGTEVEEEVLYTAHTHALLPVCQEVEDPQTDRLG